jgi:hypothetical protein
VPREEKRRNGSNPANFFGACRGLSASEDMDANGCKSACEVAEDNNAELDLEAEGGDNAPRGKRGTRTRERVIRRHREVCPQLQGRGNRGMIMQHLTASARFSAPVARIFIWFSLSHEYVSQVVAI